MESLAIGPQRKGSMKKNTYRSSPDLRALALRRQQSGDDSFSEANTPPVPEITFRQKMETAYPRLMAFLKKHFIYQDLKWWQGVIQMILSGLSTYISYTQAQSAIATHGNSDVVYGFSIAGGIVAAAGGLYLGWQVAGITLSGFSWLVNKVEWLAFNVQAQDKKIDQANQKIARLGRNKKAERQHRDLIIESLGVVRRNQQRLAEKINILMKSNLTEEVKLEKQDIPVIEDEDEDLEDLPVLKLKQQEHIHNESSYVMLLKNFCYNLTHFCSFSCEAKQESNVAGDSIPDQNKPKQPSSHALTVTVAASSIQDGVEMKDIALEPQQASQSWGKRLCSWSCNWSLFKPNDNSKTVQITARMASTPVGAPFLDLNDKKEATPQGSSGPTLFDSTRVPTESRTDAALPVSVGIDAPPEQEFDEYSSPGRPKVVQASV